MVTCSDITMPTGSGDLALYTRMRTPSLPGPSTGSGGLACCIETRTNAYLGLVLGQGLGLVHGNEDFGQKLLVFSFQRKSKAIDDTGKKRKKEASINSYIYQRKGASKKDMLIKTNTHLPKISNNSATPLNFSVS